MTPNEFDQLFNKIILGYWPKLDIGPLAIGLWYEKLKSYSEQEIVRACKSRLTKDNRVPTLEQIVAHLPKKVMPIARPQTQTEAVPMPESIKAKLQDMAKAGNKWAAMFVHNKTNIEQGKKPVIFEPDAPVVKCQGCGHKLNGDVPKLRRACDCGYQGCYQCFSKRLGDEWVDACPQCKGSSYADEEAWNNG